MGNIIFPSKEWDKREREMLYSWVAIQPPYCSVDNSKVCSPDIECETDPAGKEFEKLHSGPAKKHSWQRGYSGFAKKHFLPKGYFTLRGLVKMEWPFLKMYEYEKREEQVEQGKLMGIIYCDRESFLSRKDMSNPVKFDGWVYKSKCGEYLIQPNLSELFLII
jgi:hypothetical protein